MSTGVSDQRIKGQGKNVEERSIPWSQQVDEAYDTVSSPTEGSQQGSTSGTQFQYPPFNAKDNYGVESYQGGNRRSHHQTERYSHQSQNFSKKYENENSGHSKYHTNSNYNYGKRSNNDDRYKLMKNNPAHRNNNELTKNNIQIGLQNLSMENNERVNNKVYLSGSMDQSNNASNNKTSTNVDQQGTTAVKQMTWASIASQPAKPTLRSNLNASTLKKKGPGMPPPPMVPGKHNMDINSWDTPKNGPILVPPPLPTVIPFPIVESPQLNQNKTNSIENKVAGKGGNENGSQRSKGEFESHDQNVNRNNNWSGSHQQHNKMFERNIQHQNSKATANNSTVRPPWVPEHQQQQQQSHHLNFHGQNQPSAHYQFNSRNSVNQPKEEDTRNFHYNRQEPANMGNSIPQNDVLLTNSPNPSSNLASTAIDAPREQHKKNIYNPQELDLERANLARFFVIKSYSEDDIYRSIKYKIWCSTDRGNKRLDDAFQERQQDNGFIYLLFSVNGSRHFCGVAQMLTCVDYDSVSNVWAQRKWKGSFKVKWLYVKDVPNHLFRCITIETNENKPVTKSRDTQEVPNDKGILIMKIIHDYRNTTSLSDDFSHYEQRQEDEKVMRSFEPLTNVSSMSRSLNRTSGAGDYNRGDNFDNNKNHVYHRDRKNNFNRGGYQGNYDNRRANENSRNMHDNGSIGTNHNNRENNYGDSYNNRSNAFRNNYNRRDERNDENISSSGESRSLSGNFSHRIDNRISSGSFRERDRDSYKRKGGWRSNQRSIELCEQAEI